MLLNTAKPKTEKEKREISSQQPETVLYRYSKNRDAEVCVGQSQIQRLSLDFFQKFWRKASAQPQSAIIN